MNDETYCCIHKCFNIFKFDHVDGIACKECNQFGYCGCSCTTFIEEKQKKEKTKSSSIKSCFYCLSCSYLMSVFRVRSK